MDESSDSSSSPRYARLRPTTPRKSPRKSPRSSPVGESPCSPRSTGIPLAQRWVRRTRLHGNDKPSVHLKRIFDTITRSMRTGNMSSICFGLCQGRDIHYRINGPLPSHRDYERLSQRWCPMAEVREAVSLAPMAVSEMERDAGYLLDEAFGQVLDAITDEGVAWFITRQIQRQDNPFYEGQPVVSNVLNLVIYWHPETLREGAKGGLYKYWLTLMMPIPDQERLARWYQRCCVAMDTGSLYCVLCCIHLDQGYYDAGMTERDTLSISGAYHYLTGTSLCEPSAVHWKLAPQFQPVIHWFFEQGVALRLCFRPKDECYKPNTFPLDTKTLHDWALIGAFWDEQALVDAATSNE